MLMMACFLHCVCSKKSVHSQGRGGREDRAARLPPPPVCCLCFDTETLTACRLNTLMYPRVEGGHAHNL